MGRKNEPNSSIKEGTVPHSTGYSPAFKRVQSRIQKGTVIMNLALWSRPRIMGIVNINDDSFSGDGTLNISAALEQAGRMVGEGADIIDIGAESARTNRPAITVEEEIARLLPFIEQWPEFCDGVAPRFEDQLFAPLLSVNSWRSEIVEAVLKTGKVDVINDIGGMPGNENAVLCARHGAMLLIMHTVGSPKIPHFNQTYDDIWQALEDFFRAKIAMARSAGLSDDQIILDPGIDFAKQCDDNLTIYRDLERLNQFGFPILLPISRKTVIGEVLLLPDPASRDAGTIASLARGIGAGTHIFRVHNVKAAAEACRILWAIHQS